MIIIKETIYFIKKMRRLIAEDRYFFEPRDYSGQDYAVVLLEDFGITPDEAIEHIKNLNVNLWIPDVKPTYGGTGAFIFKKIVNNTLAYIKLKIEQDEHGDILVVISFHESY